ncbi:MAG TPA: c-type cytochrome [Candidatus Limnocylindria bacterium]|nr:c-type cytochrome [Candidatus Limnocylindria bacterium]
MARQDLIACAIAIALAALLLRSSPLADAQEMEVIAGGEIEYQNYCAVCHGVDGRGQGIMSKYLTVRPTDLTQIAKKSGGAFPFWQVYRTIDGREEVRGHGTRDMPVWGDRFRAQAGGNDSGSRAQAAGRLLGLVFYLQHIQE